MKLTKAVVEVLKYHGYMTFTESTETFLKNFNTVEELGNAGFITDRGAINFLKNIFDENGVNHSAEVNDHEIEEQALNTEESETETPVEEPVVESETKTETPVEEPVVESETKTETPVEEPVVESETKTETPAEEPVVESETKTENPVETPEIEVEAKPKKKTTKKTTKKES